MNLTVRDLLDAGVHFGHQRRRWNPRSKSFVYDHRHGVSIIDLEKSHAQLEKACSYVEDLVAGDKPLLLVGTKRQAQEMVREAAAATGMPFCANRWLGGTLTNFETIKRSVAKFKRYQAMENDGSLAKLPKKEAAVIKREMARMQRNFEGIQDMDRLPAALFVIDIKHEEIAVAEAKRLDLPVIALVDTNSDPAMVSHPIPGNDDATKSIRIILDTIVESIQNGLAQRESRRAAKSAAKAEAAKAKEQPAVETTGEVSVDGETLSSLHLGNVAPEELKEEGVLEKPEAGVETTPAGESVKEEAAEEIEKAEPAAKKTEEEKPKE